MKARMLIFCLLFLVLSQAWAFDEDDEWAKPNAPSPRCDSSWFAQASVGGAFPHANNSNYVFTGPGWPPDYYQINSLTNSPFVSAAVGKTWGSLNDLAPFYSLSLAYTYVFNSKLTGKIFQYSSPEMQNYTYSYLIQRQTLMLIGKLDLYRFQRIMPFFTAGFGYSNYRISQFQETATPNVTPRVSPGFSAQSTINPSYLLGVGFDFDASEHVWVSIEYNFGYFGYAPTGTGDNTPTATGYNYANSSIKAKPYVNIGMVSIYYLFNGLC